MSRSFMFFRPSRLPLTPEELSEETVQRLTGMPEIRASLDRHFGTIEWVDERHGRTDADGRWVELTVNDDPALPGLSLRCSMRMEYGDVVQALCDRFGWVAFDETPALYQPGQPRTPV